MPRITQARLKEMARTIGPHREEPDISLEVHLARRKRELGREVLARTRIYLDTRFWLLLRDVYLGRSDRQAVRDLFDVLLRAVKDGVALCPINEATLFEIGRQEDPETRMATVRLMDALSLGVVIENTHDRIRTEVADFLNRVGAVQGDPGPPLEWVWLKVGHALGTPVVRTEVVDPEQELAVQKGFADALWSITLEEMLTETPLPESRREERKASMEWLTRETKRHEGELRSFEHVYEGELAGIRDAYEDAVVAATDRAFEAAGGDPQTVDEDKKQKAARETKNVLRNVVRKGLIRTALPTSQVLAGLYAAVRWQKNRGFHANDIEDFYHAAAAIPYCDVFLTEKFLATIVTRPPLSLTDRFETAVENVESRAASVVEDALARSERKGG